MIHNLKSNKICIPFVIVIVLFGSPVEAGFWDDVKKSAEDLKNTIEDVVGSKKDGRAEKRHTEPQQPVSRENAPRYDPAWVREIQQRLKALGFNPGPVDGAFGGKTGRAIQAFERSRYLAVTGLPTPGIMGVLREQSQTVATHRPPSIGSTAGQSSGGYSGGVSPVPQGGSGNWPSAPTSSKGLPATRESSGGLVAQPPSGGMTVPAPGSALIAPAPANMAALTQKFGLRIIQGRPVIQGEDTTGVLTEQDSIALNRFFELIRLGLNPETGKYVPPSGSTDGVQAGRQIQYESDRRALCIANLFLSEKQKNQVLETQKYGGAKVWKGTGQNEFEVDRARKVFTTEFLPQIVASAPRLPLEFVHISRVDLEAYDQQRGGFPIAGIIGTPYRTLVLPRTKCLESVNAAGYLPFSAELPTFWALDPQIAEKIIKRISLENIPGGEQGRKVFAATIFTLSAEPSAKVKAKYQRSPNLIPLAVTVKSLGLYEDPDLERPLHTFELQTPASAVLLAGVPKSMPSPKQVVLNQETVTLLLLKSGGDVLDRSAWEALARLHLENDKAYYNHEKKRKVGGSYRTLKLKSFDPDYIPFFPKGFNIAYQASLTDQQLKTFKQWSLKRAAALPNSFVLRSQLKRDQKTGVITIVIGSFRANDRSPLLAGLVGRGYVPGQIVSPDLNRLSINSNSKFDATLTVGQGKSRVPIFVLANLLKTYAPQFSQAQGQKLFGDRFSSSWWNPEIELDLVVQQTEQLGIDDKTEAFVIRAQPVAIRILNNDASAVLYQQAYQVAALDPNQSSAASPTVAQPSQAKMPYSAEVADLLMVKFLPDTLNQAAIERMILARWSYETGFNRGSEEPQWGRFFVEGKPKPNAQQRAEIAPKFKSWILKRAQAMSTVVTVVFPFGYTRTNRPGPLQFEQPLPVPVEAETRGCRFKVRALRSSKPVLAKTHDRACDFLKDASTILGREIYIGSVADLFLERRSKQLQSPQSLYGAGVGPRMNCGKAIYGQDEYCSAMLKELRSDLLGKSFELDDVLVIDKEVVIPDNRPDLTARSGEKPGVELDVEIVGIRRANRLPPSPFLTAYRQYEDFVEKFGLGSEGFQSKSGYWTGMFERETVPLFLLDAKVLEARLVEETKNSRNVIAKLPLQEPRVPDASLLKIIEPERVAAPGKLFGPDVIGLRLGMSFDEADKIIRKQMKVGRVLKADRAWQTKAATGNIEPYTSGRLYEAQDGGELIIIYDEPPAAPGVILGLGRRVSFPNGKTPPAAIFANLKKKYGKASSSDPSGRGGQVWYEEPKKNERLNSYCVPSSNPEVKVDTWRNTDGSLYKFWKQSAFREHSTYAPELTCNGCINDPSRLAECATGLSATFDTRGNQKWDDLVIRLFDQRVYAEQYQESKRLIDKGEGGMNAVDTGLDLKL